MGRGGIGDCEDGSGGSSLAIARAMASIASPAASERARARARRSTSLYKGSSQSGAFRSGRTGQSLAWRFFGFWVFIRHFVVVKHRSSVGIISFYSSVFHQDAVGELVTLRTNAYMAQQAYGRSPGTGAKFVGLWLIRRLSWCWL